MTAIHTRVRRTIFLVALVAAPVMAQTKVVVLDAPARADAIQRIGRAMERHYVHVDRAKAARRRLDERAAAGAFEALTKPVQFADAVTSELREVCQDLHLRLEVKKGIAGRDRSRFKHRPRGDLAIDRHGFAAVQRLRDNIGYIRLRFFARVEHGGATARAALQQLAGVDALVLDIRDNTGGSSTMVQLLASYFFAERTNLLDTYWRSRKRTEPCFTKRAPLRDFLDVPLFIVVDRNTISAGEMFAYCLQAHGRATVIGETTAGAANPASDFAVDSTFEITIPTGVSRHPKTGVDWEGTGVRPDRSEPLARVLATTFKIARKAAVQHRGGSAPGSNPPPPPRGAGARARGLGGGGGGGGYPSGVPPRHGSVSGIAKPPSLSCARSSGGEASRRRGGPRGLWSRASRCP